MARHNREGKGEDQLGKGFVVSYQPDWFHQIKVTRDLDSGRQSTKTLYRNPEHPQADPGSHVRTRVDSAELGVSFEIILEDPGKIIRRITVETVTPNDGENVAFVISGPRNPGENGNGALPHRDVGDESRDHRLRQRLGEEPQ
jgi:hypothetical protein